MLNSVLILGDGLLGTEIVKQTDWEYISRKKDGFDVEYPLYSILDNVYKKYNTVVNCIAYTKTYDETPLGKEKHWNINYIFPVELAQYCIKRHLKLVHISTDYIYAGSIHQAKETDLPVHAKNWYSYTKLLADAYIQRVYEYSEYKPLIIRTSFKPKPFPYKYAIMTQMGNFDYVDIIAELIIKLIKKEANSIYNVGTKLKTMFDLAKETVPNIMPSNELIHPTMPTDVSMDTRKMRLFLNEN